MGLVSNTNIQAIMLQKGSRCKCSTDEQENDLISMGSS
jgi:hypothetical protein